MKYQMINEQLVLNHHQRTWLQTQLLRLKHIDNDLLHQLEKRYVRCNQLKGFATLDVRRQAQVYQLRRIYTKCSS